MATIEQMAKRIAAMKDAHVGDIAKVIADNYAPGYTPDDATPAPFHAGQTVDAATAWEAMGFGWEVAVGPLDDDPALWHMQSADIFGWSRDGRSGTHPWAKARWDTGGYNTHTLTRIHPSAHQHAMQRLLADGLKVGSRVEVVHRESNTDYTHITFDGFDGPPAPWVVVSIHDPRGVVYAKAESGESWNFAAHCLKLLPAESEQQDGVDIDDVMLEDIAPLPLPDNRPAEWKNKQHFHSFNGGVVTAGVDTDGDMGLIDKSGYSIGIRCGDVPAFAAWLSRNFPAPNPEDQVPPATATGEGAGLRVGQEVYIKAWVIDPQTDCNGDVHVAFDRDGKKASADSQYSDPVGTWAAASALRPVAASESAGGGE